MSRSGTGSGTITSSVGGIINCGTTCQATRPLNEQITLTAAPASGSTFAGWTGGGCSGTGTCTFAVTNDVTIQATFNLENSIAPPTITLTSPTSNAIYTAPAAVRLAASASIPAGGTIDHVTFYNGTIPIVTLTTAPYDYTWTGVPAGIYTITASAYDQLGTSALSGAATITVSAQPDEDEETGGDGGDTQGDEAPGGQGGADYGSEGYKALITDINLSGNELGAPITLSLAVQHGIPAQINFAVEIAVMKGTALQYSATANINNLLPGRAHTVTFINPWNPETAGDYNITATLSSRDKKTKFDVKSETAAIYAQGQAPEPPAPPAPPVQPPDQNKPAPTPPPTGLDSDLMVMLGAATMLVVATALGIIYRRQNEGQ